ncbi:hypothetical protein SAMN05421781_0515 [Marinococcus luteus]|uniref:HEPN domain-containing protein n=1 Tax=Marinococcus luteus TaxID=1122204 RepID=A0A1H2QY53_9BACI|nr:hypothetical protein [Marinococcus luteus]SDW12093.1 hypothetical protein SAMN05421781_0515 [Marinococcus luteus]
MSLKEKVEKNLKAAELLESEGLYNASCNRFYYHVYQKFLHLNQEYLGYSYDKERGSSHVALTNYYKSKMHNYAFSNFKERARVNDLPSTLNAIKKYREIADYEEDDISAKDINSLRKKVARFNELHNIVLKNLK